MKKFFALLTILSVFSLLPASAQQYMWHPGQLSAWLQLRQKTESKDRCTFVDYPGNFYARSEVTYFRGKVHTGTTLDWAASGTTQLTIDGKGIRGTGPALPVTLKPGTHKITAQVTTHGQLPALFIQQADPADFEASTDGKNWYPVESDPRFNNPVIFPDARQEVTVNLPVKETLLLRNAHQQNGKLVLGPHGIALLDFHEIEMGQLHLQATGKGTVSFQVGESVEEAMNTNQKVMEQIPIAPVTLTGNSQEITLIERAARYVCIQSDQGCTLENIEFQAHEWPVTEQMQFECDDPSLNEFWKASVATLHTALHNFYLDGVKRDYLPWAMDAVLSSLGGDYAFGEQQVSRNGISVALLPENPTKEDLGVVDYPFHALIGLKQEYLRYGDLRTSLMYQNRILSQLDLYESLQDEKGFVHAEEPTWGFIPGWSKDNGPETFGVAAYAQMMLYENFRIAAYFCKLWKDAKRAAHYTQKAKSLKESILKNFWDADRKVFINGYKPDGSRDERISYHSQYWAVLTDLYPSEDYDYLYGTVYPNIPAYTDNISYEKGYECLAYIKAGKTQQLLTLLQETFYKWLEMGNTRFPENFKIHDTWAHQIEFYNRPYGLSLCHGANGVPGIMLALHGILGFTQSDTTPNEYTFRPNLLHLNHVKARIPVKEGYITVELQKGKEPLISAPKGAKIMVPKAQ